MVDSSVSGAWCSAIVSGNAGDAFFKPIADMDSNICRTVDDEKANTEYTKRLKTSLESCLRGAK